MARPRPLTRRAMIAATTTALIAALAAVAWAHGNNQADAAKPTHLAATPAIATTLTIGGTQQPLPWPTKGQAGLMIQGIGQPIRSDNNAATRPGANSPTRTKPTPIASVTKIMTAYLILRDRPLPRGSSGPTLTVTTAEADAYPKEKALNQSAIPITAGEHLTERQALEALMLPSANNIARILARWHSGSIPNFLIHMNATATALGMTHTRYTDPSGWDPATVSTIDDQLKLAEIAMTIPAFADIVAMPTTKLPIAGPVRNVNRLLGKSGVIGIKTGSMSAAGGCLIFAANATIDGQPIRILGGVLGQTSLTAAFTRSQALIAAASRLPRPYTLIHTGDVVAHASNGAALTAASDVRVLGWPGLQYQTAFNLNLGTHTTSATTVGTLTISGLGDPITIAVNVA